MNLFKPEIASVKTQMIGTDSVSYKSSIHITILFNCFHVNLHRVWSNACSKAKHMALEVAAAALAANYSMELED